MKYGIITTTLCCLALSAVAAPRNEQAAREIAAHFLQNRLPVRAASAAGPMASAAGCTAEALTLATTGQQLLVGTRPLQAQGERTDSESMYVYNLADEAFVIVSGDDAAEPILAYGTDGPFVTEGLPDHIRQWLQTYADEMAYAAARQSGRVIGTLPSASAAGRTASLPAAVAPILNYQGTPIQWDQNDPFNNQCPNYMGYRSVAGCVATALSQIMYYHRWPEKGQGGTKNYITPSYKISQSFDFSSATFNWDLMLPRYQKGSYTDEQANEAAKLTHAVGVAVEMDYAPEGSGAVSLGVGMPMLKYFNYDKNLHYVMRDYFNLDEWIEMIKTEISEGRPICYAGTSKSIGHQFVFDGYDENNMVHVNWGWAGMSDGYFRLSALAPASLGTGGGSSTSGGFIFNQAMWLGMQRPSETSVPYSFLIIHNRSITIDKTTAMLGENITLQTYNYYNASVDFEGEVGLVLFAEDGTQHVLASKSVALKSGNGYASDTEPVLSFTGKLPTGITDGSYYLAFASKATGEPSWKRIRADFGYNDRYGVQVEGGKASLKPQVIEPNASGTLMCDHTVYTRCRCQFTAKLTNTTTSEYFGLAYLVLYKETETGVDIYGTCGSNQVSLPVGEEVEVVIRGSIEGYNNHTVSAGTYKACVALEHQGKLYQVGTPIDLTVKRIPSGMAQLKSDAFTLDSNELPLNGTLSGNIKISNSQSVYSGNVGIILFAKGANTGSAIWEEEVFLENGSSADITFSVPVQWQAGEYTADLRYNDGYTNSIAKVTFTIKDEYSGIVDVEAQAEAEVSCYTLDGKRVPPPGKGTYILRQGNKTKKIITL